MPLSPTVTFGSRRLALPAPTLRGSAIAGVIAIGALALTTVAVAILESEPIGIADASPVYLVAVVVVAAFAGTTPAVLTAIAAFLGYDILFTEPRLSLIVADPSEWLDLVLFLFVALVIGRLVSIQHARADEAARRAAEANALFSLSRALATATSTADAARDIALRVATSAGMRRVWIVAGPISAERLLADTGSGPPPPSPSITSSLVRTPGDEPAKWVRTHTGDRRPGPGAADDAQFRVRIEVDDSQLGALVATRDRAEGEPSRVETRILALAADQIAVSLRRDQLRQTATELEVARQTDVLKTALIDSVSHDLRTPLASIRATAGGLADPELAWSDDARRDAAAVIDSEAARLDRLVNGVLDLSRIASGALHPDLEPHELWSVVEPVIDRMRPNLGSRPVTVDVSADLPPVLADAVLLDVVLTNLLDNIAVHTGPETPVSIAAALAPGAAGERSPRVGMVVADGGSGVRPEQLATLFERFRRATTQATGSRRGLGIGLSVVRGLVEAMGGEVAAGASPSGGLAITVTLRAAPAAPGEPATPDEPAEPAP